MARHHANVISSSDLPARIVAVIDPDPTAVADLAATLRGAIAADSLSEALGNVQVDVVHVCSPPSTHSSVAVEALEAGCHVYVEKPFAEDSEKAALVLQAARERRLAVCSGHQLLFESPAREARSLIPKLGKIQHVESYFSFRPVRGSGGQAPVSDVDQLLDILPHPVYLLLAFLEYAEPEGASEVTALELGEGTVHALVRRGDLTGSLVVSVTGRPIENFVRVVGTNGTITGDFVRSVLVRHIGAGTSGIDKLLAPYQSARQMTIGTTRSMAHRFLSRKRSYPGLSEIFASFYSHILDDTPRPVSFESILDTVRVQELVADALGRQGIDVTSAVPATQISDGVLVTGGTGMLGRRVVQILRDTGRQVRVLARRLPAEWNREEDVHYVAGDLAGEMPEGLLEGISSVVHCAAATSGGFEEHQLASIDATERLLRTMASSGVRQLIHVSSLAVVEEPRGAISDTSPLLADPRASGPYAWGKLESERLARSLGDELGLSVSIVRPAAIVDYEALDPPGRLGKKLGNVFVAVGGRRERLGVVDLTFCAQAIVFLLESDGRPQTVNLLDPELPTRRMLVDKLKEGNPDLRAAWIPRWTVHPLNWMAWTAQKVLRPGTEPVSIAAVFENRRYDTSRVKDLLARDSHEGHLAHSNSARTSRT
jgi:predicted dehydrogenase/nucleoside-diphosphate-sugar epimerase